MIDEKRARRGLALVFFILLMDMMGIALIIAGHAGLSQGTHGRRRNQG